MATPNKIAQTPPLLDLRPDIIKRGSELFGPEGIDEKNKAEVDKRFQGLPSWAKPKIDSQTGKVRSEGTLLDPLNILGQRQSIIDEIIEKGGQDLINSYDSATGKYGDLSGWNRTLDGITDDDITKGLLRRNQNMRQSDPEFQKDLAELEKNGVSTDSLTTNLSIQDKAQNFRDIKTLETQIRGMDKGSERLKEIEGKPTRAQLESLITELKPLQPGAKRKAAESESRIDLQGNQGQAAINNSEAALSNAEANQTSANASVRNADANMMTANTGRIQAVNADRLAQAELDFKNSQLKHNYDISVFEAGERAREANLDRNLRKDLSILGLEDKRDERKFDRERDERKERTLMIMQLLNGLKNSASGFVF